MATMSKSNEEESDEAAAAAATDNEDVEMSVQDLIKKLNLLYTGNDTQKATALTDFHLLVQGEISLSESNSEWENCLTSFDEKSVLDVPFLALPKVEAAGSVGPQNDRMGKYMSRDTKSVKRAPLKEAYRFDVVFKPYGDDEDGDLLTVPGFVGKPTKKKVQRALHCLLERSADGYPNEPNAKQEVQQLTFFSYIMVKMLSLFGYTMTVSSPPLDDFTFSFQSPHDSSKATVEMVGEGKDATALPQGPLSSNFSHQLCTFGFATWLVSHYVVGEGLPNATQIKSSQEILGTKLQLRASAAKTSNQDDEKGEKKEKVKVKLNAAQAGRYERALSTMENNSDFDAVVVNVLKALETKEISPLDALLLWAAVVQACFATVHKRNRFTLVMNMKNMWFIKLRLIDGQCQACMSDPVPVGSPGSNLRLLSFLNKARTEGSMDENEQTMWEESLTSAGAKKDDSGEGGADGPASRHGQSFNKKQKTNKGKGQAMGKKSDQSIQAAYVASLFDERSVVEPEFMAVDKHGVVVPYFHQIEGEVGVLGGGRCGQVKKIKWRDGFAAKKEYLMDSEDDGRDGNEVFRHERHVYFMLHRLWGKYVPTLLFHKDWPRHPYLGLEVGEPMSHKWEDWSREEEKQANDAIAAVEGLGWNHGDIEARNFVRLTHEDSTTSIALMDFEDASYVGP
jgi:hypothetical protein